MLEHAAAMGATGVVAVRYTSHSLEPGVIEVVAYGTAVANTPGGSVDVANPNLNEDGSLGHAFFSTTNEILGHPMPRSLGIVRGVTVRSRNVLANIGASLGAMFMGGEVGTWTALCETAREEALQRLSRQALNRGAQGVVAMRYETNEIAPGVTEVLAYGTAVTAGPDADPPLFGR
mmetsp:Transcript_96675/g.245805  ORF Transcript_96675/g.245805 Transcript_96675/m.245805 type:complete len:176 (-) Transcript_96675:78-605(-)